MGQSIEVVDAFTDRAFSGNPAAVCMLSEPAEAAWMQAVAAELNLSETAFVRADGAAFALRWFTPATEVDLCGHATLASAHVLWQSGALGKDSPALFDTSSGRLTAARDGDWIVMDFPAEPATESRAPERLAAALGAEPVWCGRNRMDVVAELDSEDAVRRLAPDMGRLAAIETRGVIVTAAARAADGDYVLRFFGPRAGVPEDPVTGSAHCALAPYWAARLGRDSLVGVQLSKRGGVVRVEARGPRVSLAGRAVSVWRGELL
jgi:PhzF family phenazine biosynthesis protein